MNKFEKLGLSEELLKSINELGFEKPTPIQENIIPVILEGYDVIGQAQTGCFFIWIFPVTGFLVCLPK